MMSFRIRREISTTISIFTFFLLASLFFQQEANAAMDAWDITSQNIGKISAKAEAGDAYYQTLLGNYASDRLEDDKEALYWYRKAAEQGYAEAQVALSWLYRLGDGMVSRDTVEALKWLRKAAEQGNARAIESITNLAKSDSEFGFMLLEVMKGRELAANPEVEKMIDKAIKGYGAGLEEMGKESFMKALKTDPLFLYLNKYQRITYALPLSLAGEILLAVKPEKEESAGFWFTYAHTANLAAQPALALIAVKKLEQIITIGGVLVTQVISDSLASKAGILEGDIILEFNKDRVRKAEEVLKAVKQAQADRKARLLIKRGDRELIIVVQGDIKTSADVPFRLGISIQTVLGDKKKKKEIQNITALLKANAYIQMGRDKDAYAALLENGEMDKEDFAVVNYINLDARPLLKDKKKLSLLTGIEESKFTGKYEIPNPQAFQNIETGKLITPAAPPKLEIKPETAEPRTTTQPVQKSIEPDVMILD